MRQQQLRGKVEKRAVTFVPKARIDDSEVLNGCPLLEEPIPKQTRVVTGDIQFLHRLQQPLDDLWCDKRSRLKDPSYLDGFCLDGVSKTLQFIGIDHIQLPAPTGSEGT